VVAKNTTVGRRNNMERLKAHWQRGSFDGFFARNVTVDIICELRDYLLNEAPWRYHFGKAHKKFKPVVVNHTLWVLRVMLDIAVERTTLPERPDYEKANGLLIKARRLALTDVLP